MGSQFFLNMLFHLGYDSFGLCDVMVCSSNALLVNYYCVIEFIDFIVVM